MSKHFQIHNKFKEHDDSFISALYDYARQIGIDPDNEPELMYLAMKGFTAPLPSEWRISQTDSGKSSYINLNTKEISMNHPYNEKFSRKVIKERERLILGKKECKTSEKKNESLSPSRKSTQPKLAEEHRHALDLLDSCTGASSEKLEQEQAMSQNDSRESSYVDLSTQEISMNRPCDDKFSRKVIKERERRTLGKKECKINEKKNESLSRKLSKPKLAEEHQHGLDLFDSGSGCSSEKSEPEQAIRHKNKQNKQEDRKTEEKARPKAKKKAREEKKSLKRQISEKEREEKQIKVRMEYETLMMTLRAKDEQAAEMKRTRAQLRQELEQFKSELDLQIQEERKRLKEELEESQRINIQNWRKQYIVDYKKKLADILQEARNEMQQDHQKKVETLRLDHLREMNSIRQKCIDEQSAQRQSLLSSLQEEKERLEASHSEQLENIHLQFDKHMEQMKLEHLQKEADLMNRKKMLVEKQEEVERQIETLDQLRQARNQLNQELEKKTKDKVDWSRKEEEKLKEASVKVLEMGLMARPEQHRLEKRVEQLEKKYKCLSSGLETEMDKMKAEKAKERVSSCKNMESAFHMGDNESEGDDSDETSGYKTFHKIQSHEKEYVEKKQILNHLRKVKSCLEEEMCIASGEKAKKESDETTANKKRPRQDRGRENEEKQGIREEEKQLEKRIEQLEKRVEHLDNKHNHPSDRLGSTAYNISHFPVQEEHLVHRMNMNQMCTMSPIASSSVMRYPRAFGVNCSQSDPKYRHQSHSFQGTTGGQFAVKPPPCHPSHMASGICNLHFMQSSGDINSYREAVRLNSTKSWLDTHRRAL